MIFNPYLKSEVPYFGNQQQRKYNDTFCRKLKTADITATIDAESGITQQRLVKPSLFFSSSGSCLTILISHEFTWFFLEGEKIRENIKSSFELYLFLCVYSVLSHILNIFSVPFLTTFGFIFDLWKTLRRAFNLSFPYYYPCLHFRLRI